MPTNNETLPSSSDGERSTQPPETVQTAQEPVRSAYADFLIGVENAMKNPNIEAIKNWSERK